MSVNEFSRDEADVNRMASVVKLIVSLNHQQLSTTTPVSLHFNQAGHSINDVSFIPIELIRSKRDSVRKAREAHLINKAKTLHPFGINRSDEAVTHLTLIYS